ncbi:HAD family hydrolase [Marinoscillum sp.]|uniref:HAD family hydrolase n=1 Tax=Marinoscillum sp. TaxID=2024838 RepID=UPI003BAD3625
MRIKDFDNIIWDFDGVILDSDSIRRLGFVEALDGYPKSEIDLLIEYHNQNGGLSRYHKFRYFFETIRCELVDKQKIQELARKFSLVMMELLLDKRLLIKDAHSYIKLNSNKQKMHIASGSDQVELRNICSELDLYDYFISVNGSPTPKVELVEAILRDHNYEKERTCLIGDSVNDLDAAHANGIKFVGYNNPKLKPISDIYEDQLMK